MQRDGGANGLRELLRPRIDAPAVLRGLGFYDANSNVTGRPARPNAGGHAGHEVQVTLGARQGVNRDRYVDELDLAA
jgi:hypothetical protein